jgi:hypothetical protein
MSKPERSVEPRIEGDVSWHNKIDVMAVPHCHLDDSPLSDKGTVELLHGPTHGGLANEGTLPAVAGRLD